MPSGPSAIAGLMGAEWSEVTDETTTVLLECANFDGPSTQRSSIRLGLRTEGSSRWEKGLDPHLPPRALALASQLMVELTGARLVPGTIDVHGPLPEQPVVGLRKERLEALIGVEYTDQEIVRALTRLGYEPDGDRWIVPTWRAADTTREVDLIEEVMRIAGIERVPAEMPGGHPGGGRLGEDEVLRRLVVDVLRGAGLSEAATLTLWDAGVPDRLRLAADDPRRDLVELQNPMSAEWTAMRTLVFPGPSALGPAQSGDGRSERRDVRGRPRVPARRARSCPTSRPAWRARWPAKGPGSSRPRASSRRCSRRRGSTRPSSGPPPSRSSIPGARRPSPTASSASSTPRWPRRSAWRARSPCSSWASTGLRGPPREQVLYRDVTSFPPLRQDIAVIVAEDVPAGRVVEVVRSSGGPELAAVDVFDVYRGPPVPEGRKSVALHLVFQSSDRTLTDAEGDAARAQIVAALASELGGELRE